MIGSFRTLFPREENIFIITRLLTVAIIIAWIILSPKFEGYNPIAVWLVALGFIAHLIFFKILDLKTSASLMLQYRYSFMFDIVLITALVDYTGGLNSNFYLLYYLLIGFSSYQLGMRGGLTIAMLSSLGYILINLNQLSNDWIVDLPIRLGMGWFYAFVTGAFSRHFKHSSNKLLHLLDTLNERTTELEHSQVQLETIYETSRSLGEIHNLEEIYSEINNIADHVLGYPMCSVLLLDDNRRQLKLTTTMVNGRKEIFKDPPKVKLTGITGIAFKKNQTMRISDLNDVKNYISGLKGAQSEMAVPMIARGKIIGILNAESTKLAAFTERDEKLFTVLAASAGMAIENARLHERISNLTMIDDLTGINNYRYFVQRLEEEKRRASRYNLPLSLIMMDLDWFKKTNDTYGHEVGNVVLKEIVQVVKTCIRDTDTFCRYGGERIRSSVEKHDFSIATGIEDLDITLSLGTTSFPDNGLPTTELVQTVDMALYRAKGAGKNIVCAV